ncbi:MAG: thymidylate synthase, partial [Archaeoglobaceae archaeon]|nr:thymidylate synthase [Archaeoglobaceae archaeon]
RVEVLQSDPCGSAYFVAKRMRGFVIESSEDLYKEIHQHQCAYPCMASMERDIELIEAPFHLAGYIMVYNFSKALGINARDFVPDHFKDIVII